MRTAVVIPVRLASTRLPGKALFEIQGRSAIEHLIDRVKLARRPNLILLCTTTRPEDSVFADIARRNGIEWFAGSERDILRRFLDAAATYGVEFIVGADGDDPFKDPTFIDQVIERYETTGADFIGCEELPYGVPISYSGRDYSDGKKITRKDGARAVYHTVRYNLFP